MPRLLPHTETVVPGAPQTRGKKAVQPTPKQRREALKGAALALRLREAADRHDADHMGEDVTDLSSADFIARLRR